jgi:HD-like signal output (HDOD) protein
MPQPLTTEPLGKPPSLKKWLARLENLRDLPLLPETPSRVLDAINRPNSTADSVAQIIRQDPVLCLHLFDSANRIVSKSGNEIKHLPHLLSLLGLPNVGQQVRNAPVLSEKQVQQNPGYIEALTQSHLCAEIACRLMPLKGTSADEAWFPALLLQAPLWSLWHHEPKRMAQRQVLLNQTPQRTTEIDELMLGMPLPTLVGSLLPHWALPHSCRHIWHMETSLTRLSLAHIHRRKTAALLTRYPQQESILQSIDWLLLSCQLAANQFCISWFHRHSLRAHKVLAYSLHQPLDKVIYLVHQAASHCAWLGPQQMHPASRLLMRWDQHYLQPRQVQAQARPAEQQKGEQQKPPIETTKHSSNQVLLQANLTRLNERGADFANLNQLLGVVVNTLNEGVGLKQVTLLTLNRNRDTLQSHFSTGIEPDAPLRHLRLPLDEGARQGVIGQLLEQNKSLMITAKNRKAALNALPPLLTEQLPDDDLALMPLLHRDHPIGLLLAASPQFTQADYQRFKHCGQTANKAISAFAQKQRQQRKRA